jgi:hypothetical protein
LKLNQKNLDILLRALRLIDCVEIFGNNGCASSTNKSALFSRAATRFAPRRRRQGKVIAPICKRDACQPVISSCYGFSALTSFEATMLGDIWQYIPQIIKEAATSPLGLLALMIIALAILAFFFFKDAGVPVRVIIFIILFSAVVVFAAKVAYKANEVVASASASPTPAPSGETVVEFPEVDTTGPGHTVSAAPYLHKVGISVTDVQPETSEVVLMNNRGLYQGQAVLPTTSQNLLTQINTGNVPASFLLRFNAPVDTVSFTRPALYPATKSGITHPAWSVHALDSEGNELSSQSEALTRSFSDVPARAYALRSPAFNPISAVRFDSDPRLNGKPFAGFSAVLIERLTIFRAADKK